MPFTTNTFASKHWQGATLSQAAIAARIANAIIRAGGDEGRAIATGIKTAKKLASASGKAPSGKTASGKTPGRKGRKSAPRK